MAKNYFGACAPLHRVSELLLLSFFFSLILFAGCGPSSWEDFQIEGDAAARSLAERLDAISSHEELMRSVPLLKTHYERLVTLIIEARLFQQRHPEGGEEREEREESPGEIALQRALMRIYAMEGGGEALAKAEREALLRLDAFEKRAAAAALRRD